MLEEDREYLLGCSGYFYWSWKGRFYPEDIKPSEWLRYYSQHFKTLELNSTFYRFPAKSSLRRMARETQEGFRFSVKMNRVVTHFKKLRNCKDEVLRFYETVREGLGEKLVAVLFQLPPSLKFSTQTLDSFLSLAENIATPVLEPRHVSWWREEVYSSLREKGIIFCTVSSLSLPEELVLTSDTAYIRFHGKEGGHRYLYTEDELRVWAESIKKAPAKRVFVYFNNDHNANAVKNCRKLADLLGVR